MPATNIPEKEMLSLREAPSIRINNSPEIQKLDQIPNLYYKMEYILYDEAVSMVLNLLAKPDFYFHNIFK